MNHAKQIANMLGLEIGEKFKIKGHPNMGTFWFVDDVSMGMKDAWQYDMGSEMYDLGLEPEELLEQVLTGFYEVERVPWKPKKGDVYWYYSIAYGDAYATEWENTTVELISWKTGNCFRTEVEAETIGKEIVEQIKKEYEEA